MKRQEQIQFTIDPEFQRLIRPLTDAEFSQLRENILDAGEVRDPLKTWNGIILDGHNRWRIIQENPGIPWYHKELILFSREEAIQWIIKNQLGRRNITAEERELLAGQLYTSNKRAQGGTGANQHTKTQIDQNELSAKRLPSSTAARLAEELGVSASSIKRAAHFAKGIEAMQDMGKDGKAAADMILSGKANTPRETVRQFAQMEPHKKEEVVQGILDRRPHVSYNSGNQEWYTPAEYIEAARAVMGSIDLDPASSEIANQTVKASAYYTAEANGLDKKWSGNVWLNPPYASDLIGKFIDKLTTERGTYNQAVVLVNNATETEWFHKLINAASAVLFPKGRVKFYKPDGETGAPLQGQAVVYIGDAPERFLNEFRRFGWGGLLS